MKRVMAFVLVVMMLCIGAVAMAETAEIAEPRASNYFSSYGISLSKVGSGKINITFSCSCAIGTASQIGVSSYNVYRYDEGIGWYHVSGPNSGSYSYGASSHSFAKTFNGVAGEKYRVTCTFICVKNGLSESKGYTSRSIQ